MVFRCSDLENKDLFSKSVRTCCVYFEISFTGAVGFVLILCARMHAFAGSFLIDFQSSWKWDTYSSLQDWSEKERSESNMEAGDS